MSSVFRVDGVVAHDTRLPVTIALNASPADPEPSALSATRCRMKRSSIAPLRRRARRRLCAGRLEPSADAGSGPARPVACARARPRRARRRREPHGRARSRPRDRRGRLQPKREPGSRARLRREARRLVRRAPSPRPRLPLQDRGRGSRGARRAGSGEAISFSSATATRRWPRPISTRSPETSAAWGIRRVAGRVLGDERHFDSARSAPGWKPWFLGVESAPLSALSVDERREPRRERLGGSCRTSIHAQPSPAAASPSGGAPGTGRAPDGCAAARQRPLRAARRDRRGR